MSHSRGGARGAEAAAARARTPHDQREEDSDPGAVLRRHAAGLLGHLTRPRSYAGLAREAALTAFHAGTYPLGLLPGLRASHPASPADADAAADQAPADARAAETPVVLVHGYIHNRSAFLVMSRALRQAGFQHVRGINYNPLTQDCASIALRLAEEVEHSLAAAGARRCVIVGHSMGGVIARHYVQLLGGEDHVDTVVTLGAPHRGSYTSYLGWGRAAAQLRPGSSYLRHLEETARPSRVRWVAYYSDLDLMVVPAANAKLVHPALAADNINVRDTGHLSLLLSSEVLRSVTARLSAPPRETASEVADLAAARRRRARAADLFEPPDREG